MSEEKHEELVSKLLTVKGKVILSGYDNKIYNRLINNGWKKVFLGEFNKTGQKDNNGKMTKGKEFVWINYKIEDNID